MNPAHDVSKKAAMLGWSVSAVLHGIILTAAAVSVQLTVPHVTLQKEPFRWEVSLSAAPQSHAVIADGLHSAADASLTEARSQDIQDTQPLKREIELPRREKAVFQDKPRPIATMRDRAPESSSPSAGIFEDIHSPEQAAIIPAMQQAESVVPPPEVERQHDAASLQVETQLENPAILQRPHNATRHLVNRTILPDYTWLMDTLRSKLERIKTYPSLARANHWEGRVVVQVSIDGDGRILNPEIEESSGHWVLDQAALGALAEASPLRLDHSLEGDAVVMSVPLNYRLE